MRSTISFAKIGRFHRRRNSARAPIVRDDSITPKRSGIPKRSGPALPRELEWSRPWDRILDWQPPHAKWFVGGHDQRQRQLPRSARARAAPQQGGAHLGRRARRSPHADLLRAVSPGVDVRERPEIARRSQRRSRGDLPAAHSRAGHLHARLRADRRRAQRRVRRLQRRVAARSDQRLVVPSADHRRWRPSARTGRPAQAGCRRGRGRHAVHRTRRRGAARRRRGDPWP